MSITFANAKNGCQGSGSSTSTSAGTLSLFTAENTKGYNFYKNKSASNGNWEIAVFGRAHNYSSSAETYDYTIYVFGRKLNSAASHGDFKITFYYRDKSYSVTNSRYIQSKTGKVRLLAYHTFDGLNCEPSASTTIGAKVVGPSGTEAAGTITATDTADFSGGASWSVYVQSDSSIKLEGTNLTTNRGFRHAWVWQWKRSSASSYTTDATTNTGADNTSTSLSHTFTGLVRNTSYDVRARFYLRNYDPTDDTGNNPVPLSSRTIVRTATTDKSDLSGSVKLTGNRYVGGTITADVTNTDNATLAYQWCYNDTDSGSGTAISGATSSTYTVTSNRVGKYIYCKVTFTKDNYNTKVIRKYTQGTVYKRSITADTTISGIVSYGQTLTADVTCNSTGTKTYQWWYSTSSTATSGTNISGATSSTYTIGSGLVGKYIGCTVNIAESDKYLACTSTGITSSWVTSRANPAVFPEGTQSDTVTFSTSAQSKSFTGVTHAVGDVFYGISSQKNSSGTNVNYFDIPTSTNNSITIATNTPADTYTLNISVQIKTNGDYTNITGNMPYTLTVNKASGTGSVTMSGWTYGGTVTNPVPSSSTNGTSNVSYTWYDSNKVALSSKPTSTATPGTYYVKATFPATTNYNAYTTDYVAFTISKATNPLSVTATQSGSVIFSTSSQSKSFTAGTGAQGSLTYSILSQQNSSGTSVSYFTIPTNTSNSISIAANTPAGSYTLSISAYAAGNTNYNSESKTITYTLTVDKKSPDFQPSISGNLIFGSPLTINVSTPSDGALSYQWWYSDRADALSDPEFMVNISGATNSTYVIGSGLVGKYIGCYVRIAESSNYKANGTDIISSSAIVGAPLNTISKPSDTTYTGAAQTPTPEVTALVNGTSKVLVKDTDYSLSYSNNTNSGTASVTATGKGNYTGTINASWTIAKYNLSNATIASLANYTYDSSAKTPTSTVTVPIPSGSSTTLTSGTHFTWSYSNNTNAGTATVTITAKDGTNYTGSKSVNFTINKASLKVTADNKSKTVNDSDPAFTYSYSGNVSGEVPKFSGSLTRDSGEAVGTYTIKIGTLSLQDNASFKANNYSISFTSGTLTINSPAVIAGTPTITVSQNYLNGDYGVNAATISYSVSGGTGTLSSIVIKSSGTTVVNSTSSSGSAHGTGLSTSLDYSVTYKDTYGNTDTKTGTVNVTYPYNKAFDYTYAYKNASGVNQAGTSKTFTNDGKKATQYCLTADEWNEMLKFLYSAAYRKNGWSNTGLTAPTMISSNSNFTKTIYNSALALLNKLVSTSYNNVVSKERITAEHLNRFRTNINNNR